MEKTVKELCLVCGGERWLPDPLDASRSIPCVYCDQLGWVEISLASLGEARPKPLAPPEPAPAASPAPRGPGAESPQPPARPLRKKPEPPARPTE
jgi:hypothetical protein